MTARIPAGPALSRADDTQQTVNRDVAALIAAYGAWRRQVWGVVLLLVVNLFWIVQAVTTLFDPSDNADVIFASVMLVVHLFVVWCCLGPGRAGRSAVDDRIEGQIPA